MKLKHAFILFFAGIFLGVGVSPFTDTRPQEITYPTSLTYANEQELTPIITPAPKKAFDINNYLNYFDDQQNTMKNPKPQVLAAETETKTPTTQPVSLITGTKTIAFFGDSMIDTMGTDAPYFSTAMKNYYPNLSFNLLNYGVGAQQVDKSLERVDTLFEYKDRQYEPITRARADIIILGSFAYNPYDDSMGDLDRYKAELTVLIDRLKQTNSKVIFLATIAPLKTKFGQGEGGVNWPADTAYNHATKIQTYMEAAIAIAQGKGIPVIDLYHPTLQSNGEGIGSYVSSHDGIHPSVVGHNYIASQVSAFIANNKLLEP